MSRAFIVVCLGFGDSGKGSLTDYLVRQTQAEWVIRFNGGAQAAHNVVITDGRHHRFSQFGSGSFLPRVKTFLSRFMLVDPLVMVDEVSHLRELGVGEVWERMYIDENAPVVTPYHIAANQLKERSRGENRHGSCGMGIGETVSDWLKYGQKMLVVGDLRSRSVTEEKLRFVQKLKIAQLADILPRLPACEEKRLMETTSAIRFLAEDYLAFTKRVQIVGSRYLAEILKVGSVLFEGAQGVLLDERYGFYPNTTWSKTTFENALTLLEEFNYSGEVTKIGLLRAYQTRHGPGPFPTEDSSLSRLLQEAHNTFNPWQRDFRVGHSDLLLSKYAVEVSKPDIVAVSMMDRLPRIPIWQAAEAYQYQGEATDLGSFFDCQNGMIRRIKVLQDPSLDHQMRLGQLLGQCRPKYRNLTLGKRDVWEYVGSLEGELKVPIKIASFGPTADDKKTMTKVCSTRRRRGC